MNSLDTPTAGAIRHLIDCSLEIYTHDGCWISATSDALTCVKDLECSGCGIIQKYIVDAYSNTLITCVECESTIMCDIL